MIIKKHKKTQYRYVKDSQNANTQIHGENDLLSPGQVERESATVDAANADGDVLFEHISDSDKSLDGAGDDDGDKSDMKDVKLTRQQRKKHKKE